MSDSPRIVIQRPVSRTVVRPPDHAVAVSGPPIPPVVAKNGDESVLVTKMVPRLIRAVEKGPQGPAGETDGAVVNIPAGETIHGHRVVRTVAGALYEVDTSVPAHAAQVAGISMQAATPGTVVQVRTAGALTDSGWTLAPGLVFCGAGGALTQTPSETGWLLRVGRVLSPTSFLVDIDDPYLRTT